MKHIIHNSGGQHHSFLIAKRWTCDSTLGEVYRDRPSQPSTNIDSRLCHVHTGDEMLSLVMLAFDLTQQGYNDMFFWFPVVPEMRVEVFSQSFQVQKQALRTSQRDNIRNGKIGTGIYPPMTRRLVGYALLGSMILISTLANKCCMSWGEIARSGRQS